MGGIQKVIKGTIPREVPGPDGFTRERHQTSETRAT